MESRWKSVEFRWREVWIESVRVGGARRPEAGPAFAGPRQPGLREARASGPSKQDGACVHAYAGGGWWWWWWRLTGCGVESFLSERSRSMKLETRELMGEMSSGCSCGQQVSVQSHVGDDGGSCGVLDWFLIVI